MRLGSLSKSMVGIKKRVLEHGVAGLYSLMLGHGNVSKHSNNLCSTSPLHGIIPSIYRSAPNKPLVDCHTAQFLVCWSRGVHGFATLPATSLPRQPNPSSPRSIPHFSLSHRRFATRTSVVREWANSSALTTIVP